MYRKNRKIVRVGALLDNAIHNSAEWKETESMLKQMEEKFIARRAKEKHDWEDGERIIKWAEERFGPRHRRRDERRMREDERLAVFDRFYAERRRRPVVIYGDGPKKTLIPPIVHKDPEEAWWSVMQIFRTASYLTHRLHASQMN